MKAMIGILMMLSVITAFYIGPASAQDVIAENVTAEDVIVENVTDDNATVTAPVEQVSRFTQLSKGVPTGIESLSKNIAGGYRDVTQTADTNSVFAREAGVPIPSVKVSITKVNVVGEKWVEITNQAVGSWDLTGWKLASAGSATYTFPQLELNSTDAVKVHEGVGTDSKTDLYTPGPLWTSNLVELQDTTGRTVSSYDITTAPVQAPRWVNPLSANIQY